MDLFGQTERDTAIDQLHAATAIYTAEPVVRELMAAVDWPSHGRLLVDSSCGDGAFLAVALERLLAQQPDVKAAAVVEQLRGYEIHPYAVSESRARVAQALAAHGWTGELAKETAREVVIQADFLTEGPNQPTFDVIAGNPPYLRFVNLPDLLADEYQAIVPPYAISDMLYAFLDRSRATLKDGGVVALVTADRWLTNEGASELRGVIGQRLGIRQLRRLDASSAFYRPKLRKAGTPPRVHPVAVVLGKREECALHLTSAPVYPGAVERSWETGLTLEDIANIKLAPYLGTDGVFVVDEATAKRLPESAVVPAVGARDVSGGVMREPSIYAIRTQPDQAPPAAVLAHLDATLHRMCARGRMPIRWMPPEPFHTWNLSEECLVVPRIAKTLRPTRVRSGVLPINHNVSVVSKGSWSLEEIEAALCDPMANEWARAHAAPLENGYFSLTTRLLRRLPIRLEGRKASCE